MIILRVRYQLQLHKAQTQKKEEKLPVVKKERQQKKAEYAGIKQRKARKNMVLINLQLIFVNKNWL